MQIQNLSSSVMSNVLDETNSPANNNYIRTNCIKKNYWKCWKLIQSRQKLEGSWCLKNFTRWVLCLYVVVVEESWCLKKRISLGEFYAYILLLLLLLLCCCCVFLEPHPIHNVQENVRDQTETCGVIVLRCSVRGTDFGVTRQLKVEMNSGK